MSPSAALGSALSFEEFWAWLHLHYNCILRAGGPGFVVFDQADVHWHLGSDLEGLCFAQVIRGKETMAELYFNPGDIQFVQTTAAEDEQVLFECMGGAEGQTAPLCHFLMAHGFDANEVPRSRTWTH